MYNSHIAVISTYITPAEKPFDGLAYMAAREEKHQETLKVYQETLAELDTYIAEMESALANLAVERAGSGHPSDIKTIFEAGLTLIRGVDNIRQDMNVARADFVNDVQNKINPTITMFGLDPAKFSIEKVAELRKKALILDFGEEFVQKNNPNLQPESEDGE